MNILMVILSYYIHKCIITIFNNEQDLYHNETIHVQNKADDTKYKDKEPNLRRECDKSGVWR